MGQISVAEAAERLGVGVSRIHQRISAGSLRAERVGSQWVIDEGSLAAVLGSGMPGRPLSARSAWALVAYSQADQPGIAALGPMERSRARDRLRRLLAQSVSYVEQPEAQTRTTASLLRSMLRNRAQRRLYRASARDLPDLRLDERLTLSGLSHPRSGIASGDFVEGYLAADHVDTVVEDYLLSPAIADKDASVIVHVAPAVVLDRIDGIAPLLLSADLAEHRRPREEARAVELLHQIISQNPGLLADSEPSRRNRRNTQAEHA